MTEFKHNVFYYSCTINNTILVLNKSGVYDIYRHQWLIKEKYKGYDYFRIKGTHKRFAVKTLKHNITKIVGVNI